MMTIFSVLVFMLVQGRAVCDEVFPISLLEGFFVNQSEWHARDRNEPLQVRSMRQRPAEFSQIDCSKSGISEVDAVDWITKCIVDEYNFEANENENEWISQPSFKDALRTDEFKAKGAEVQKFFLGQNDWEVTKMKLDKTQLLMITAARYLLVTWILYEKSSLPKLTPCSRSQDGKYVIPVNGVCYPAPYGSASYKSDYDVGLIGPESGSLTKSFNRYFQNTFRKPSELVFDTNVYAFTLEFAIPSMFINLPWNFKPQLTDDEKTDNFKIQELASAYYKVFKYNEGFFQKLSNEAAKAMMADTRKKERLDHWMKFYQNLDRRTPMRPTSSDDSQSLRVSHNEMYQKIVEIMSDQKPTPYQDKFAASLSEALIYAAEAYHTRGAIRHVVGAIQIKWIDESVKTSLSTNDLWVSMIENWGEANKEYNHCGEDKGQSLKSKLIVKCFPQMSKYMWRVLEAMRLLQERLPERMAKTVSFNPCRDPQCIMKMWLRYKKEEKTDFTNEDMENVRVFLKEFGCRETESQDLRITTFSLECLGMLNNKVNAYNKILADLFVHEPGKLLRK